MPRVSPSLENFNGGEWTPLLHSATQVEGYSGALARCFNMIPLIHRAVSRRPGTLYVCPTRNEAQRGRLLPFRFGLGQAYAMELAAARFRFLTARGRVEDPPGTPVELVTPYALAELAQVKRTQDSDRLYLWHPRKPTQKMTRESHVDWSIAPVEWIDGPYLDENDDEENELQVSAKTGTVQLDWTELTNLNDGAGLSDADVGRLVRVKYEDWHQLKILTVIDPRRATAEILGEDLPEGSEAPPAPDPTVAWRLGAWGTTPGHPAAGTFYQQRLVAIYTDRQPTGIFASGSGRPEDMAPTEANGQVDDDNAWTHSVKGEEVNAGRWIAGAGVLFLGSSDTEFSVQGSITSGVITPENKRTPSESAEGSADLEPVIVGNTVFFVNQDRTKLMALSTQGGGENYPARDASLYGEHIARKGIVELAYWKSPWSVILMPLDDGTLGGYTILPQEKVQAWHRHALGGRYVESDGRVTNARVESICAIPSQTGEPGQSGGAGVTGARAQTDAYLQVLRTIDGSARRYIEVTADVWRPEIDTFDTTANPRILNAEDAFFVDCGLTFNGWNRDSAKKLRIEADTAGQWAADDTGTLSAEGVGFAPFVTGNVEDGGDVGREFWFRQRQGDVPVKVVATAFVSSTELDVRFLVDIPAWIRDAADSRWARTAEVISNLAHLEGESVVGWVDGGHQDLGQVTDGEVTLQGFAAVAHVGLPQPTPWIETLDLAVGAASGTARAKPKAGIDCVVSLYASAAPKVGRRAAQMEEIVFNQATDPMDIAPALFTGNQRVEWPAGWEDEHRVIVTTELAGPLTLRSIIPDVVVNG